MNNETDEEEEWAEDCEPRVTGIKESSGVVDSVVELLFLLNAIY